MVTERKVGGGTAGAGHQCGGDDHRWKLQSGLQPRERRKAERSDSDRIGENTKLHVSNPNGSLVEAYVIPDTQRCC